MLKGMNGQGCALVGDQNYYERFVFKNNPCSICECIPQEYFLVLPFGEQMPEG